MPRGVKGSGPHSRTAKALRALEAGETRTMHNNTANGATVVEYARAPNGFPLVQVGFYGDPAKELYSNLRALLARTGGREVHIITSGLSELTDIVVMNTAADQLRGQPRILVDGHGRGLQDAIVTTCNEFDKVWKPVVITTNDPTIGFRNK